MVALSSFCTASVLQVALLVALAKVLAELNTADEATLQQCLHVTHRIVAAYRGLWPKQRATVHSALNILLAGLRPKAAALQSLLPRLVSMLLTYTLRPADDSFMTGGCFIYCLCFGSGILILSVCLRVHVPVEGSRTPAAAAQY